MKISLTKRKCSHRYEEDITMMSDPQYRILCLHCGNVRFEEREHVCNYSCWLEHHPQEFVDCE